MLYPVNVFPIELYINLNNICTCNKAKVFVPYADALSGVKSLP